MYDAYLKSSTCSLPHYNLPYILTVVFPFAVPTTLYISPLSVLERLDPALGDNGTMKSGSEEVAQVVRCVCVILCICL